MTNKSLSERIAERVSIKQPKRSGKYLVSFLAIKDDVKRALDDGWTAKTIWETLSNEGKIQFSYHSFTNYINREIRKVDVQVPEPQSQKEDAKKEIEKGVEDSTKQEQGKNKDGEPETKATAPELNKTTASTGIREFKFSPTSKKEDLI